MNPSRIHPDGSFVSAGACNLKVAGSNPGQAGYLSSWLCKYSVPSCSKAWSLQCCPWYCALHRTLEVIRKKSRASGFFLSRYCHDCAENYVKQCHSLLEYVASVTSKNLYFLSKRDTVHRIDNEKLIKENIQLILHQIGPVLFWARIETCLNFAGFDQ